MKHATKQGIRPFLQVTYVSRVSLNSLKLSGINNIKSLDMSLLVKVLINKTTEFVTSLIGFMQRNV